MAGRRRLPSRFSSYRRRLPSSLKPHSQRLQFRLRSRCRLQPLALFDVVQTGRFSAFVAYFEVCAKRDGILIGSSTKSMTPAQFACLFGDLEFATVVCRDFLYCFPNSKQGIVFVQNTGAIGNFKSACKRTIPFQYDFERAATSMASCWLF